ncbi:hypothetical protein BJX61DRAFT_539208 [Aspergillus egyptiacus]|nr:hypothetical protein BJX61DRAFT_539208 [Aspergillus egyptiacus]
MDSPQAPATGGYEMNPMSSQTSPPTEGYDRLASLMASDKGLSIFRSFKRLNSKNLLYLQAEIALKEKELNDIIREDRKAEFPKNKFAVSVHYLKETAQVVSCEQWNTALAQHAQLLRLKAPHKKDLKVFDEWLKKNAFCLTMVERHQWFGERKTDEKDEDEDERHENERDLIALWGRYEQVDAFTRLIFRVFVPFYHRLVGHKVARDIETGTVYYDDEKILRFTRLTSMVTSSMIPASSMLVLYYVNNMLSRLIIIVLYNIGFSIILGLLAKARRVEVFAASTA